MPGPGGRPPKDQNAGQSGGGGGGKDKNKGGGGDRAPKVSKANRVGYAYAYFINAGMTPAGAAGMVGNLKAESNVDPNNDQPDGPGMGIAQWTYSQRWQGLLSWAQKNNKDPRDLETQLQWCVIELKSEHYRDVWKVLTTTNDVRTASNKVLFDFESPADQGPAVQQTRYSLSNDVVQNQDPNARIKTDGGVVGANGASGGGVTTSSGESYSSPEQDGLSARELAEESGWSYSFLKTQPELWKLFKQAVAGGWSPARFVSAMRDTKWFQSNSDTMRQAEVLRKTDPETWDQRVDNQVVKIMDAAAAMGAQLTLAEAKHIASQTLRFGFEAGDWNNILSDYVTRKKGSFVGQAGVNEDQLREYAKSMGVNVSSEYVKKVVQGMARGAMTFEEAQDRVDRWAMSAFPTLRDDIKQGLTVQEAADPYIQTMAGLLEINPSEIDLFTPKIRKALMSRDADNKPAMKTLWEFEQDVRKDDRYQYTKQARDTVDEIGSSILGDWGFI